MEVYLLFFFLVNSLNAQFLEQPDAGTVFVPVQDQVTLTCSVEEGYVTDWHVVFPDGAEANAANEISSIELRKRNFTLEGVATSRSTLSLWETETHGNNGTNITCRARGENGAQTQPISGNFIQVIFFGIPPPPTNLSVTEDELDFLNISWSLGFIEGVPMNYTLTVLNLNTTSPQPIIIPGLLDQYYVFETSRPCDVYSFTVTAVTAAGNSTPSQVLIFTRNSNKTCSMHENKETENTRATDGSTTTITQTERAMVTTVVDNQEHARATDGSTTTITQTGKAMVTTVVDSQGIAEVFTKPNKLSTEVYIGVFSIVINILMFTTLTVTILLLYSCWKWKHRRRSNADTFELHPQHTDATNTQVMIVCNPHASEALDSPMEEISTLSVMPNKCSALAAVNPLYTVEDESS